jgi:ATP-dependent protease ClpP protease subunit
MPTVYVSFSADITPQTTETLIAVLGEQVNKGVTEVYLMFSTAGGSVMHGFNLYNVMRALPLKLITHNVGSVNSIGNVTFLAGQERYACPQSTFMFHGVGFDTVPGLRLEEKFLRERLDAMKQEQRRIESIIVNNTNLHAWQVRNFFREARTKDADYALSVGIVHQIKDVQIPAGSPVVSLVFQR